MQRVVGMAGVACLLSLSACGPSGPLDGARGDRAGEAIADEPYQADLADYSRYPEPDRGLWIAHRIGVLRLADAATVGQVNAALGSEAELVASMPSGVARARVLVRLPVDDHQALFDALDALEASPAIASATPDALVTPTALAPRSDHEEWTWESSPSGGNWGLEAMRVPAMWNLRPEASPVPVGIIDSGFADHPDLVELASVEVGSDADPYHGTEVLGVMAAVWDNETGVEGVLLDPEVHATDLGGVSGDVEQRMHSRYTAIDENLVDLAEEHQPRVVNMSFGYAYADVPDTEQELIEAIGEVAAITAESSIQTIVEDHAAELEALLDDLGDDGDPHLVAAAGNWSPVVAARWMSPMCHLAAVGGDERVECVEGVRLGEGTVEPSALSCQGGTIAAPSHDVLTTEEDGGWTEADGTSQAAPFVTAILGNLLALDADLSHADLGAILETAVVETPATSEATDPRPWIDAYRAALEIDVLRGDERLARTIADLDDGTVDGSTRLDRRGAPVPAPAWEERGDGRIDIRDFRVLRDQILHGRGWRLGAPADHSSLDANGDGVWDTEPWSRADLNGDGNVGGDPAVVGGVFGEEERSDLDVLATLWEDDRYDVGELPALLEASAEIHTHADRCWDAEGVQAVSSWIEDADGNRVRGHTHQFPVTGDHHVVTVPSGQEYTVVIEARDVDDAVVSELSESVVPAHGEDLHFTGCAPVGAWVRLSELHGGYPPMGEATLNGMHHASAGGTNDNGYRGGEMAVRPEGLFFHGRADCTRPEPYWEVAFTSAGLASRDVFSEQPDLLTVEAVRFSASEYMEFTVDLVEVRPDGTWGYDGAATFVGYWDPSLNADWTWSYYTPDGREEQGPGMLSGATVTIDVGNLGFDQVAMVVYAQSRALGEIEVDASFTP